MATGTFDLWLPCQPQSINAIWLVADYRAAELQSAVTEAHVCVYEQLAQSLRFCVTTGRWRRQL